MIEDCFTQKKIGNLKLQNSFILSPMCMCSAEEGCLSQFQFDHYLKYAHANLGAIILESTAVSKEGRITTKDLCIYHSKHFTSLSKFIKEFRKRNKYTKIGIQLSHAGNKASLKVPMDGTRPYENLPIKDGWTPVNLETSQTIVKIIREFEIAAKNAHNIGFDFIEIHMGHRYLLHQMISKNNTDVTLQLFTSIRNNFPKEKPIGVRLSQGYSPSLKKDTQTNSKLISKLISNKCSYITLSNGGIKQNEQHLFLEIISQIKSEHIIPLMVVGEMNTIEKIKQVQEKGSNFFAIGRALLRNPYFIYELESQLKLKYSGPRQYSRAFD
jgi:2,4-dienoyl-CoA reductase-like NADH-dependent reductase (Old Yellow Enzyme family)